VTQSLPSNPVPKRVVVVVEDDPDHLQIMRVMLQDEFIVRSYASPSEALAVLQSMLPDIVLLDIGLPEFDGIECLHRIRSIPRMENVPAIAVSALTDPDNRNRCLSEGFQAFVPKPIMDIEALRQLVRQHLQQV
jgi:CheY-like chemotaxis protein